MAWESKKCTFWIENINHLPPIIIKLHQLVYYLCSHGTYGTSMRDHLLYTIYAIPCTYMYTAQIQQLHSVPNSHLVSCQRQFDKLNFNHLTISYVIILPENVIGLHRSSYHITAVYIIVMSAFVIILTITLSRLVSFGLIKR